MLEFELHKNRPKRKNVWKIELNCKLDPISTFASLNYHIFLCECVCVSEMSMKYCQDTMEKSH